MTQCVMARRNTQGAVGERAWQGERSLHGADDVASGSRQRGQAGTSRSNTRRISAAQAQARVGAVAQGLAASDCAFGRALGGLPPSDRETQIAFPRSRPAAQPPPNPTL